MFQDKCDESVEDYKKCIELSPDFPQAHVYKCLAGKEVFFFLFVLYNKTIM